MRAHAMKMNTGALLCLAVLAIALAPGAALAKAKRAKGTTSAPAEPVQPAEPAPAPEPAAAPVPAATLPIPPAPTPTPGRIEFGPAGAGMGSVVVKGDKLQISFDGRDFGAAPVTITNVPKGDYVVEGTAPDGKQVSRPVTVDENAEASVDLGAGIIGTEPAGGAAPQDDGHPRLQKASRILLGVSAGALAVGLVFGVLELKAHSDYESAPANQAQLDSLAASGHRDALVANVSFALCGAALVAAGITALPSFLKSERPPAATTTAFAVTPTRGGAQARFALRF